MDGSRVVKIFELDAAQGYVGLAGLAGLAVQCLPRRRRQEKEDGKKRSHISSWQATMQTRRQRPRKK